MKFFASLLSVLLVFSACKSTKKSTAKPAANNYQNGIVLNNYIDSVSYSLGLLYGESLSKQGFDDMNNDLLIEVFRQTINNTLTDSTQLINSAAANPIVNNYFIKKQEIVAAKNLAEGQAFMQANKTKPGVKTTASGLQYKVLKEGTGKSPEPNSSVTVYYTGTLIDGTKFDGTKPGSPATFGLNGLIQAWKEGILLMKEGAKFELYVPANMGYGAQGSGNIIGPNATLIFEIELVKVD